MIAYHICKMPGELTKNYTVCLRSTNPATAMPGEEMLWNLKFSLTSLIVKDIIGSTFRGSLNEFSNLDELVK